jgi:hypothetical protein
VIYGKFEHMTSHRYRFIVLSGLLLALLSIAISLILSWNWLLIAGISIGVCLLTSIIYFKIQLFRHQNNTFDGAKLAVLVLDFGNKSGNPKGLTWQKCEPIGEHVLAAEQQLAFMPYEISFLPIPGSDMEDIPAAKIPRPTVAIFRWTTQAGWQLERAPVFNLPIDKVIKQRLG